MSSPRVRIRSRRTRMTVAVTGAATPVGDRIARALLARAADGGAIDAAALRAEPDHGANGTPLGGTLQQRTHDLVAHR